MTHITWPIKRLSALVWTMLAILAVPLSARAGGLEFGTPGTQALGRGGAFLARPGSPMALFYNPANLASVPGVQLTLQSHLAFYGACFQRSGTYSDYEEAPAHDVTANGDTYTWGFGEGGVFGDAPTAAFPEVCNSGPPGIVPELILSWRVDDKLGIGVGLVAPAAVGHTQWGEDMTIGDRTYRGTVNGLPAPSRYNLVEEQLIVAYPTIGFGYQAAPWLRFGAAFGIGFGFFSFENIARPLRGENFASDVYTELSAVDSFIPRVTLSAQIIPHENLDIALAFTYSDDIDARADVTLTSGYYREQPLQTLALQNARLHAPQPWQIAVGVRYADRIHPRSQTAPSYGDQNRIEDPMLNERWDIELDFTYERNSRVDRFGILLPANPADAQGRWSIEAEPGLYAVLPPDLYLAHNWQDSIALRLGGDWNIVPGRAAVRLGLSFETKGVQNGYEQLDFMPFMRFGGGVGFTLRFGKFDLSLSYAHIRQITTTVSPADANVRQINADERLGEIRCADDPNCDETDPNAVAGRAALGQGTIVNIGRYSSSFNVLSLDLTWHFD